MKIASMAAQWTLILASVLQASASTLSGATGSHDPSRMILCNGKYYVYSTGGGMKFSSDGIRWTAGPSPFALGAPTAAGRPGRGELPASLKAVVPEDRGIWAPDVIFYRGKYLLYYSACAPLTVSRCGIGLLTSPTLDPAAAEYKWTDAGVVIYTDNKVEKKSAIDPGPFVDAQGGLWLSWGSGYANGSAGNDPTIVISKLDDATGLRSTTDTMLYPVAPGHIEAAYVHYHAGFYYAFWNDGGCCSGTASTYQIHVARSESPKGPWIDRRGTVGAGEVFMSTIKEEQLFGPGHMGIESEPGLDRFTFHYYNAEGKPVLGVRTLVWGADGWPAVGADLAHGTYKVVAGNGLALGVHGSNAKDGAEIELQRYTGSDFQKWTAEVTPEGYYRLTSVGSGKSFQLAELSSGSSRGAAAIDQASTVADDRQEWLIDLSSNGKAYRLQSGATHKVLARRDSGKKSGVLEVDAWKNIPSQEWTISAP